MVSGINCMNYLKMTNPLIGLIYRTYSLSSRFDRYKLLFKKRFYFFLFIFFNIWYDRKIWANRKYFRLTRKTLFNFHKIVNIFFEFELASSFCMNSLSKFILCCNQRSLEIIACQTLSNLPLGAARISYQSSVEVAESHRRFLVAVKCLRLSSVEKYFQLKSFLV